MYKIGKMIGDGTYGTVKIAQLKRLATMKDKKLFAVKSIPRAGTQISQLMHEI